MDKMEKKDIAFNSLKTKLDESFVKFLTAEALMKKKEPSKLFKNDLQLLTSVIDSARRQSRIKTFNDLLLQLEYRDRLSWDNVGILKEWAVAIKWTNGLLILEEYVEMNEISEKKLCEFEVCLSNPTGVYRAGCGKRLDFKLDPPITVQEEAKFPDPTKILPREAVKKAVPPLPTEDDLSNKDFVSDATKILSTEAANDETVKQKAEPPYSPENDPSYKVDDAFDSNAENLCEHWKYFARRIKLTEYDIEEIQDGIPYTELAYEVHTKWKESNGKDATIDKLKELLLKCGRNDLKTKLDDSPGQTFDFIANEFGRGWTKFARAVGLDSYDIDAIKSDKFHRRLIDMAFDVHKIWIERSGNGATKKRLSELLILCNRRDLAEELLEPQATFEDIARKLGVNWIDFARKVKLDNAMISDIKPTKPRLIDMVYDVYKRWKEKEGKDATLPRLKAIFKSCNLIAVSELI